MKQMQMYPRRGGSIERGVGSYKRGRAKELLRDYSQRPEVGVETRADFLLRLLFIAMFGWYLLDSP